jgi:hypothetical protein
MTQGTDTPASTRDIVPGQLMRLVGDGLTARGHAVQYPGHEDERRLRITSLPTMNCMVTVDDSGAVYWEYWPKPGYQLDPGQVVSLALNVLAPGGESSPQTSAPDGSSRRRSVGQALRGAALDVELDVYADQGTFTVTAEIVAVNPHEPGRGELRIEDSGYITWENVYNTVAVPAGAIAEMIVNIPSHQLARSNTQLR